jgi:hypothetical protein
MYRIELIGARRRRRVIAEAALGVGEFRQIAADLGVVPKRARKTGLVAARKAAGVEPVETRWNGKETEARAVAGDWIVTALGADLAPLRDDEGHKNIYVIKAARFAELYEATGQTTPDGAIYRSQGVVEAIRVTGGFEIQAPWGETQRAADGWLLLNGREVYGNHRDTFAATYEIVEP